MKELKDYSIKDHPHYGSTRLNWVMIGFFIGLLVGVWVCDRSDPDAPTHSEEEYGDSYQLDFRQNKFSSSEGEHVMELELENCALVTRDFVQAVKDNRQPTVTGESVLPAMRVLQIAQNNWDKKHGTQVLPGRPL